VAFPGHEQPLAVGPPAGRLEQPGAQIPNPCPALGRNVEERLAGGRSLAARWRPREIDLVDHARDCEVRRQSPAKCFVLGRDAVAILDEERRARGLDRAPGALDADALDLVARLAQSRGVDEMDRHAFEAHGRAHVVARRSRDRSDDRHFISREAI
jgi:hypothetical protein